MDGEQTTQWPMTVWHLAGADGITLHNAWIGKGWMASAAFASAVTGIPGIGSPYTLMGLNRQKEEVWERVRQQVAPHAPQRTSAFYAFASRDHAERAQEEWFPGQRRHLLRVELHLGRVEACLADARWLDRPEAEWEAAARRYWTGAVTPDPRPEVICFGQVFFPDWEAPPFGSLMPRL